MKNEISTLKQWGAFFLGPVIWLVVVVVIFCVSIPNIISIKT